jgi:hypothetical protein
MNYECQKVQRQGPKLAIIKVYVQIADRLFEFFHKCWALVIESLVYAEFIFEPLAFVL